MSSMSVISCYIINIAFLVAFFFKCQLLPRHLDRPEERRKAVGERRGLAALGLAFSPRSPSISYFCKGLDLIKGTNEKC